MQATLAQRFAGPVLALGAVAGWLLAGEFGLSVVMLVLGAVALVALSVVSVRAWVVTVRRAVSVPAEPDPEDDWVSVMFDRPRRLAA